MPFSPSPAAQDLCTSAQVAGDLNITADATVDRVITAASAAIAKYCVRTFEYGTAITEYPTVPEGARYLLLSRPPVASITSVSDMGTAIDSTIYTVEGDLAAAGMVFRRYGSWRRTGQDYGSRVVAQYEYQGSSVTGWSVVYAGGWKTPGQVALGTYQAATLPAEIQEAAILTACGLYRRRGRDPSISLEQLGDYSARYLEPDAAMPIPAAAAALLVPYRLLRAV